MIHAELLTLLLPTPYEATDPVLAATVAAEGQALDAAHASALVVAEAISPAGGDGLWLADWERVLGLPDACAGGYTQTQTERITAALAKIRQRGGQSRAYFISLAQALGYDIAIEEPAVYTCGSPCDQPIHDEPWHFAWTVRGPEVTVREFACLSGCADPLASWGNRMLECVINRLKPAHTHVLFAYGEDPGDQPIPDETTRFAWTVRAPRITGREFTCMSGCADPLAVWSNKLLERVIDRLNRDHAYVVFDSNNTGNGDGPGDQPIPDETTRFTWTVRAPRITAREFTCVSGCSDPLAVWDNELLARVIARLNLAHAYAVFNDNPEEDSCSA